MLLDGDVEKANADIIRREARLILEQLSRDVSHGSEEARSEPQLMLLEAILTAVCVTTTPNGELSSSSFGFASSTNNVSSSSSTNLEREYVRLGIFSRKRRISSPVRKCPNLHSKRVMRKVALKRH